MHIKTEYALEEYLKQRAEERRSEDRPARKPTGFMRKYEAKDAPARTEERSQGAA